MRPVPAVIGIDIPMGLCESGPRPCEQEARKLLGRPRSSSVFPVPPRPLLGAHSYRGACSLGLRIDGRKINRQTWNIMGKIREADGFLQAHRAYRARTREVHPELSFRGWAGSAMAHGKKTAEGRAERETLVASVFGPAVAGASACPFRGGWSFDDLLDAFAVLWTAQHIARGRATAVPAHPSKDRLGLRMAIFF